MAYDERLAERIRKAMSGTPGYSERKMFGGVCFMVNGNMACGVVKDEIMVRVGKEGHAEALARPHARPMDFTGRAMQGMVYVGAAAIADEDGLAAWVARGRDYAAALPPK